MNEQALLDEFALKAPPCPDSFCPDAEEDEGFKREFKAWNEILEKGPFGRLSKDDQAMANLHAEQMARISRKLAPFKWPYHWAKQVLKERGK